METQLETQPATTQSTGFRWANVEPPSYVASDGCQAVKENAQVEVGTRHFHMFLAPASNKKLLGGGHRHRYERNKKHKKLRT